MDGGKKEKVLYVDDDVYNLRALNRLFRDESFELVACVSPLQALQDIEKLNPAVVLSDQRMPEMSGTDFLEQVRRRLPDTIRIILTGHADLAAAIDAINKGNVYRFIQKPWDDGELKEHIRSALEHRDTIGSLRTMVNSLVDDIMSNEKAGSIMRRLVGVMSYEIRMPLSIIAGYARLLQDPVKEDDLVRSYLSNTVLQIEKIEKVLRRIESAARRLEKRARPAPANAATPRRGNRAR